MILLLNLMIVWCCRVNDKGDVDNKLIEFLSQFITANKREKIATVLAQRTRYVTIALENIYHSQNVNAALRSAECFGLHDAHIIDDERHYTINKGITKGASDWLELYRYSKPTINNSELCFSHLRQNGYLLVGTSPHYEGYALHELPIDRKMALIFGTEETGLSDYAKKNVDTFVTIPMYGFTGSFNISVSVALAVYDTVQRLHASPTAWQLSLEEQQEIHLKWLRRIIRGSAELEKLFLQNTGQ